MNRTIIGTVAALGLLGVVGGSALYHHAVVRPAELVRQNALLDAQQRAGVHAREVERRVSYARGLEAVGWVARARKADPGQHLGLGAGCDRPQDAETALGRQRERGEVQCFNEAKIGL